MVVRQKVDRQEGGWVCWLPLATRDICRDEGDAGKQQLILFLKVANSATHLSEKLICFNVRFKTSNVYMVESTKLFGQC